MHSTAQTILNAYTNQVPHCVALSKFQVHSWSTIPHHHYQILTGQLNQAIKALEQGYSMVDGSVEATYLWLMLDLHTSIKQHCAVNLSFKIFAAVN